MPICWQSCVVPMPGSREPKKESGCNASIMEAQLGPGRTTSASLADGTRVWSFLGPEREILALPLATEQYGKLISLSVWPAASAAQLVKDSVGWLHVAVTLQRSSL